MIGYFPNVHVLYSVLNKLSFRDVTKLRLVSKVVMLILDSDEYWRFRSTQFESTPDHKSMNKTQPLSFIEKYMILHDIDPKVRYAWAVIATQGPIPDFILFLDTKTDLLFPRTQITPGIELLIGLQEFLARAIHQNRLDLVKYALSLGADPTGTVIPNGSTTGLNLAIDLDRKEIARFLSEFSGDRVEYHAKYGDSIISWSSPHETKKYVMALAKHGFVEDAREIVDEQALGWYLAGLIKGGLESKETILNLIKRNRNKIQDHEIGLIGSAISDLNPNNFDLLDQIAEIMLGSIQCMRSYIEAILVTAVSRDDIDLIHHIDDKGYFQYMPQQPLFAIRSDEMYELLMVNIRSVILQTEALHCGTKSILDSFNKRMTGYELFYKMLPRFENTFDLFSVIGTTPLMMQIYIERMTTDDPLGYIDKFYFISHMSPFDYDFLRSCGLSSSYAKLIAIRKSVDLSLLPFLKSDLIE